VIDLISDFINSMHVLQDRRLQAQRQSGGLPVCNAKVGLCELIILLILTSLRIDLYVYIWIGVIIYI